MLAVKAKKLLLVVGPAGTGKSVVGRLIAANAPQALLFGGVTKAGLARHKTALQGFSGVIVVDDLGSIPSEYSRFHTISDLAALVHEHSCAHDTAAVGFRIEGYFGSAILNIQPSVFRISVREAEWDANVQDRTLRYYHLYRPLEPESEPPQVEIRWGIPIEEVTSSPGPSGALQALFKLGLLQWSRPRVKEHIVDLLKASAALDNRTSITTVDRKLLFALLRPLAAEAVVIRREGLERNRSLDSDLLYLMVEFATYGAFTYEQICNDYKVSQGVVKEVLAAYPQYWVRGKESPERIYPSPTLETILRKLGVTRTGRKKTHGRNVGKAS